MPTILQLQEKRTKLVHDAAAIMQAENVTAEQRAQVNTMLADEQVIVADIRAMEALEASDKELRSTQRPHRGSPTGGQSEEEQRNRDPFGVREVRTLWLGQHDRRRARSVA